jgi:cysteine synthase A
MFARFFSKPKKFPMTQTLKPPSHRYTHHLGPTPLVPVCLAPGEPSIWCKLEFLNPSGSTKDRIARHILDKAWRMGIVGAETIVAEASSGSTSISFALACAQMGIRFVAFMPEGVSAERVMMIKGYGAEVCLTPKEAGIRGSIEGTLKLAASDPRVFLPKQFENPSNSEAHKIQTAREILDQAPGNRVDAVVSGVGTGGTLVGLYQGLSAAGCEVVPVLARPVHQGETMELECCSFSSRIPGVLDSMSEIFRTAHLPGLLTMEIRDEEAIQIARSLIRMGFPVGPSSGLNFAAARMAAKSLGRADAVIVTVFPDRMERYFSTELFQKNPALSPR